MFKKRTINKLKNRKKTGDIKDEEKNNEERKNDKEESPDANTVDYSDRRDVINKILNTKEKENSDDDDDVVCKYLFKKKMKNMNEQNSSHLTKKQHKIMVQSKSVNISETNAITQDKIYKGDFSNSKNYGFYEIDQDSKHDHRAIMERNIKIGEEILKGNLKDNIYRGKDAHEKALTINKDSLAKNKYTGLYGPVRNSGANVRVTLRIDYEPCICKDYKETGYCGFGDTCIYLHDRSDYKSGWKIEQEYQEKRKRDDALKKKKLEKWNEKMLKKLDDKLNNSLDNDNKQEFNNENGSDNNTEKSSNSSAVSSCSENENSTDNSSSDNENNLPFACVKCKKKWKLEMNPSVTECFHYFCEKCFMEMFKKNKKCFKCGLQLNGIMNSAQNIIDILNKKKPSK
ncbi:pre-mRNA-splicing factor CWC24 [Plasmodium brasilianum]|uniref:Pre-mRNA-splicing factor CWC24, putative n=2 Tax=Plasmodium (Plasmodium) TaxID=418103 RepID=A0A1A8WAY3_PLAMA|nr:pre-mRNA-splicing factor CWC24, putative [Plasmodium malariae]KAI4836834.1 pre-mRNA-splicing factor CWC24 [Plasmodium brasilianum]SBS88894.1 zinc finger protein, putative [Plasmodium malariae]SCO94134.1 pre-mRNA-splicing factor CWC24, putative [Plasmodium malariae]